MPRLLSISETAKQRSLRIPLDYYRRGDRLARTKLALTAIAGVAAALYCIWLFLGSVPAKRQLSPGPVAGVHAAWNDDCNACHQDFRPLRSDALDWRALLTSAGSHQAADQACTKCHNEPQHHITAAGNEVPSCAACHQDHRGAAADIRRAADVHCLDCHQDLAAHRSGPSVLDPPPANITAFAAGAGQQPPHPDFRSLVSDPGNVKFNHWLHLQPGIAPADAKNKLLARDAAGYERYANAAGLVDLTCAACHEPENDGRQMRPIAYERHCAACHPLTVATAVAELRVPHGLSSVQLSAAIDGLLRQDRRENEPAVATATEGNSSLPIIPGRTLGNNLAQKLRAEALGQRSAVVVAVNARCGQCHDGAGGESGAAPDAIEVEPPRIPSRWFAHARFDHSAHRHTDCRTCHEAAYAYEQRDKPRFVAAASLPLAGGIAARDREQVMIAGLETCVRCHAPRSGSAGGARHDCAECHEYHGRGEHLAGEHPRERIAAQTSIGTHLVALLARSAPQPAASLSSCAASGCHGAASKEQPAWRTAFSTWAAGDPHLQAYEVLWSARGREMTRLLEQQAEPLSESAHSTVLNRRCTGCHATSGGADHDLGVACASCHGAAEGWLHTHYRSSFARAESPGFRDTKKLSERAAACMPCHVGPSDGPRHVVDHDLIAAGHPRLAFEFHAYFESLPAHWDRAADRARRPADHHFQSWLAGEAAKAQARERLSAGPAKFDFAQLDCFRCHHELASGQWRQAEKGRELLPVAPLTPWQSLAGEDNPDKGQRLGVLVRLLDLTASEPSFDRSVQASCAAAAVIQDLPAADDRATIAGPLAELRTYLSTDCFRQVIAGGRQATLYDSPTDFEPAAATEKLKRLREAVESAQGAEARP